MLEVGKTRIKILMCLLMIVMSIIILLNFLFCTKDEECMLVWIFVGFDSGLNEMDELVAWVFCCS